MNSKIPGQQGARHKILRKIWANVYCVPILGRCQSACCAKHLLMCVCFDINIITLKCYYVEIVNMSTCVTIFDYLATFMMYTMIYNVPLIYNVPWFCLKIMLWKHEYRVQCSDFFIYQIHLVTMILIFKKKLEEHNGLT